MTQKELSEAKQEEKELLELLLKKTGVKKQDLVDLIVREFIRTNINLLTPAEKKRFKKMVF